MLSKAHPLSQVIYEGVLESPPWRSLLKRLESYLATQSATLVLRRPSAEDRGTVVALYGGQEALQAFQNHGYIDSPFAELPEGAVYCLRDQVTPTELERLIFYRQIMKPYGITDLMGFDIFNKQSRIRLRLRLARLTEEPQFSDADKQRLETIIPLMTKALTIYSRMESRQVNQDIYQDILQSFDIASLIVNSKLEVLAQNHLAEQVLQNKDGLFIKHQLLCCSNPEDQKKFHAACARLLATPAEAQERFRLESFSLHRSAAGAFWHLLIRPVVRHGLVLDEGGPKLVLLLRDPSRRQLPSAELLMDIFAISPAEARLTLKLMDGLNLTAAAAELGVTRNTARTQLTSIFAKTSVNSQAQLVKLVSDTLNNHWL